ncbi:hypothetical protein [Marinibacterium sp. SX1]|uniref:hypothetical protein n=1 Tax=Marinibacterium sp. SX1 TaxID=3388424 RepID=UPI003D169AEE
MVLDNEGHHGSRRQVITSIATKIGCSADTWSGWTKKAQVDSSKRAGVWSEIAERLKALERESRDLRRAIKVLRTGSTYLAMAELDRRPKEWWFSLKRIVPATRLWKLTTWPCDQRQAASGKPGAVHSSMSPIFLASAPTMSASSILRWDDTVFVWADAASATRMNERAGLAMWRMMTPTYRGSYLQCSSAIAVSFESRAPPTSFASCRRTA